MGPKTDPCGMLSFIARPLNSNFLHLVLTVLLPETDSKIFPKKNMG